MKLLIIVFPLFLWSSDMMVNPAFSFMPHNIWNQTGETREYNQQKIEYKYWSTGKIMRECTKVGFLGSLTTPPEYFVKVLFSNYRCSEKYVIRKDNK